jgi:serine O-acetyltransferase
VVGVPGRVVVKDGKKVAEDRKKGVDLRHDLLPDPVADVIHNMQLKIERLESRIRELELQNSQLTNQ